MPSPGSRGRFTRHPDPFSLGHVAVAENSMPLTACRSAAARSALAEGTHMETPSDSALQPVEPQLVEPELVEPELVEPVAAPMAVPTVVAAPPPQPQAP